MIHCTEHCAQVTPAGPRWVSFALVCCIRMLAAAAATPSVHKNYLWLCALVQRNDIKLMTMILHTDTNISVQRTRQQHHVNLSCAVSASRMVCIKINADCLVRFGDGFNDIPIDISKYKALMLDNTCVNLGVCGGELWACGFIVI